MRSKDLLITEPTSNKKLKEETKNKMLLTLLLMNTRLLLHKWVMSSEPESMIIKMITNSTMVFTVENQLRTMKEVETWQALDSTDDL